MHARVQVKPPFVERCTVIPFVSSVRLKLIEDEYAMPARSKTETGSPLASRMSPSGADNGGSSPSHQFLPLLVEEPNPCRDSVR
jgi:hypothetical protein